MDENNTLPTLRGIFVYNKNCIICKNALVADVPKFEDDALNTKCGPGSYTAKTAEKCAKGAREKETGASDFYNAGPVF